MAVLCLLCASAVLERNTNLNRVVNIKTKTGNNLLCRVLLVWAIRRTFRLQNTCQFCTVSFVGFSSTLCVCYFSIYLEQRGEWRSERDRPNCGPYTRSGPNGRPTSWRMWERTNRRPTGGLLRPVDAPRILQMRKRNLHHFRLQVTTRLEAVRLWSRWTRSVCRLDWRRTRVDSSDLVSSFAGAPLKSMLSFLYRRPGQAGRSSVQLLATMFCLFTFLVFKIRLIRLRFAY